MFVFALAGTPVFATPTIDLAAELAEPGVKLAVLEFYADWCAPCKAAVPKWRALHEKYRARGLRFFVVTDKASSGCSDPGWTPDRVLCDEGDRLKQDYGVTTLPQAFVYSWQGKLLVERAHVEQVEAVIERYFREQQYAMVVDEVEVIGDKFAISGNPAWVRDLATAEVTKRSKFDVVSSSAAPIPSGSSGSCSLDLTPNSTLRIRLQGDAAGHRTLTLALEKDGCVKAQAQRAYTGKGLAEDPISIKRAMKDSAQELFASLLRVSSPLPFLGKVPEVFEAEKGGDVRFKAVNSAVVSIASKPANAELRIDGKLIGLTSERGTRRALTLGTHAIQLAKEGYLPFEQQVNVTGDKNQQFAFTLASALRRIELLTTPESDAELFVDGSSVGKSPRGVDLRFGPHLIKATKQYFLPKEERIVVDASTDEATVVRLVLEPAYGLLDISTDPSGIEVSVDGEEIGESPIVGHRLGLGVHEIGINDEGYFATSIKNLEISTPLERVQREITLTPKEGGIDFAAHDDEGNAVIAEVFIDGKRVGETAPRFQHKLQVGAYAIELRGPEGREGRIVREKVHIKEHGEVVERDVLLTKLSPEELARKERQDRLRLEREKEAAEEQRYERWKEETRLVTIERERGIAYSFATLAGGLLAGTIAVKLYGVSQDRFDKADDSKRQYRIATDQAYIDFHYQQAKTYRQRGWNYLLASLPMAGLAGWAFKHAADTILGLPELPVLSIGPVPGDLGGTGYALALRFGGRQ